MKPEKTRKRSSEDYLLSSVRNALRILRSFSVDEPEKKVTMLADELGIAKSTVSRLLATLASEGFAKKDAESGKWQLGMTVLSLGGIVKRQLQFTKESRPILMKLVKQTGESAHLAILEDTDVVYIEQIESPHPLRAPHVGKRNPAFCTSSGKVLLSHKKEDYLEMVISKGLTQFTKNTITDPIKFREHIVQVREQKYAFSIEELALGVFSVASPIRNYTGRVVASVSIAGSMEGFQNYKINEYRAKVMEAAKEISENLCY